MFIAYNGIREEQDRKMRGHGMSPLDNREFSRFMYFLYRQLWVYGKSMYEAKKQAGNYVFLERIS